ncbi:VOC family protein [Janthinobacterium aquaticum]|uniref:VOC family protein n=1 Tax=Janthinobacterium sp. FT58W TaxID=2654254 RepID=UPI0012644E66|nr:hypothetical protein [Janthinobacterium sp. FT58W]KAB8042313.1 hypothetical protein GCM43_14715 [Janthinobacterium sp. FT58W]
MDRNIYITIISLNPDQAKEFYIKNFNFEEKFKYNKNFATNRNVLIHKIAKNLEVEFSYPQNEIEKNNIGSPGGSRYLFTIPTDNIDAIKEQLSGSKYFINYVEAPYASFLTIQDPMGNKVCIYET